MAWREAVVAEQQKALDELKDAQRDREWLERDLMKKPHDPRIQLDFQDAQQRVTGIYDRFNGAAGTVPFPGTEAGLKRDWK